MRRAEDHPDVHAVVEEDARRRRGQGGVEVVFLT
jgi:hypothetical protein